MFLDDGQCLVDRGVGLRHTTSCDRNISSCSISIEAISWTKCFELFMWCDVMPTIGASRSASDLDIIYPIDPVQSTIGLRGLSDLWMFGVQYILGTLSAVRYKYL